MLPASLWRDPLSADVWAETLDRHTCVTLVDEEGRGRSQTAVAYLRHHGFDAGVLAGGYKGWTEAGLPLMAKAALNKFLPKQPSLALAGDNDHGLLKRGFVIYDGLYAWLRFAAEERHNWPTRAA